MGSSYAKVTELISGKLKSSKLKDILVWPNLNSSIRTMDNEQCAIFYNKAHKPVRGWVHCDSKWELMMCDLMYMKLPLTQTCIFDKYIHLQQADQVMHETQFTGDNFIFTFIIYCLFSIWLKIRSPCFILFIIS